MRRGSRTGRVALLAVAVALFIPGVQSSAAALPPGAMPIASLGRIVPVPIPQAFVNRAGAHLTYYGGPVMAFTENAIVLWGGTGHTNALTSGLPGFFTSLASAGNSNTYDAALEYGTHGLGTDQPLTLASRYLGSFAISPSTSSTNLTDTQIASELAAQIGAGALPPPRAAFGGPVTEYYVMFPPTYKICLGSSCSNAQFLRLPLGCDLRRHAVHVHRAAREHSDQLGLRREQRRQRF